MARLRTVSDLTDKERYDMYHQQYLGLQREYDQLAGEGQPGRRSSAWEQDKRSGLLAAKNEAAKQSNAAKRAHEAGLPVQQDEVTAATKGRGEATMNDPRLTAAQDYLQGLLGKNDIQDTLYSQMSDQNAAAATTQADQLRQSAAAAGMSPSDPAFQALQRSTETGRMQANQGALATSILQGNQAKSAAASALASQRLGQLGAANQMYGQYAGMKAQQQTGAAFVPSGYQTLPVPSGQAASAPWTPPADAPSPAAATTGGKPAGNPILPAYSGYDTTSGTDAESNPWIRDAANAGQAYAQSQGWTSGGVTRTSPYSNPNADYWNQQQAKAKAAGGILKTQGY
jgi:hypothetical protein